MTREDAIDLLADSWTTIHHPNYTNEKMDEAFSLAIGCLRQTEWIPVTERLPESSGVYIVSRWFSHGFDRAILTDACYFDGTSTWHNDNRINHGREYVNDKVVAWMPLPKPYKEGE